MMKYTFVCFILIFYCLCPVVAKCASSDQTHQYVYIGGYQGLFGFRVSRSGSLLSMQTKPFSKAYLDQLLVDTRTRNVFGVTIDDKLCCYAIGPTGHLSFKSEIPFNAASGTAAIDPQTHLLYAADGDRSLLIYDLSNPYHMVKRRSITTPIIIQNIVIDQFDRSLLLWGRSSSVSGQGKNFLFHYSLNYFLRSPSALKIVPGSHLQQGINTAIVAGPRLVAGNENVTLTVYSMNRGKPIEILDHQSLMGANASYLPSSIVYQRAGSLLFFSTFYGAGSARAAQPASPIIVCQLSSRGQIGPQRNTGKLASNPRLYLDNTEHFLYVVGEEGTIDGYKISDNRRLTLVSRLRVLVPTGLVFVDAD